MSRWVHIAGIVRLDNMKLVMISPAKLARANAIRALHGQDDLNPEKDMIEELMIAFNENIPSGSEGPLMLKLHIWPRVGFDKYIPGVTLTKGSLYWADMIISGDLRDKNPSVYDEISDWIRSIELPEGIGIRQGVLTIHLEDGDTRVYNHSYDQGWMMIA